MIFIYFFLVGKTFWASLTHGLMSVGFLLLISLSSEKLLLAQLSVMNSIIYFIADLFVRFDYPKILHHILCAFAFIIALFNSSEIIIFTARLCGLIETTNPFWTFLRLRVEKSDEIPLPHWYTKNISSIVYNLAFFLVRIVWFSIVLYYETPNSMSPVFYHTTITPFYLLNASFFIVLVWKSIKSFKK